jgi:formylglycine-generating enzyme required for sulfatase activity
MKRIVYLFGLLGLAFGFIACDVKPTKKKLPAETTRIRESDGMIEIYIPAGEFLLGAADADTQANDTERPQHSVYLDYYWIDQHQVTNAQYALCVAAGACMEAGSISSYTIQDHYSNPNYNDYPVINVG